MRVWAHQLMLTLKHSSVTGTAVVDHLPPSGHFFFCSFLSPGSRSLPEGFLIQFRLRSGRDRSEPDKHHRHQQPQARTTPDSSNLSFQYRIFRAPLPAPSPSPSPPTDTDTSRPKSRDRRSLLPTPLPTPAFIFLSRQLRLADPGTVDAHGAHRGGGTKVSLPAPP